jgi:hypothetical protein
MSVLSLITGEPRCPAYSRLVLALGLVLILLLSGLLPYQQALTFRLIVALILGSLLFRVRGRSGRIIRHQSRGSENVDSAD